MHFTLSLQARRRLVQTAFFALFVLAPPLDLFRLDLNLGHFIFLRHDWTLGLDALQAGTIGPGEAAGRILLRAVLPIAGTALLFLLLAWRFGRLYCGWLCPHFSVVEAINALMRRAWGRPSLWQRLALPERLPGAPRVVPNPLYWAAVAVAVLGFALLWAVVLLTYLLPPAEIYHNLLHGTLTRNQGTFLVAASIAFALEFTLARHLFCRFGCAAGLFQSLAWMSNRRALMVGFDEARAAACGPCDSACDHACPMRLHPRSAKRKMFACTQCLQCVSACRASQRENPQGALLQWVEGAAVGRKGSALIDIGGELQPDRERMKRI